MVAYEELRIEIITFEGESDVVTTSCGGKRIQFPISDD